MIKIISNKEDLLQFRSDWNDIYMLDDMATPFQKFEYIYDSLELHLKEADKLYIIAIKDDATNRWVAFFPLLLTHSGILKFINATHTDFCQPLIHNDFRHYVLFKELSEFIVTDKSVKGLYLENVMSGNPMIAVLKPFFRYTITHDINYYSSIPVYRHPSDTDPVDAFRYVRAKQRKNLRKQKKWIDTNCRFEISRKSNNDYPQQEIETLVNQMLSDGIRVKEYFSEKMLSFWKKLYDDNILCVALLYKDDEIMSCNFMYYDDKHNEYIKWLMLYRENSWNMMINIMISEYLYNNGGGSINFARGIYDYKLTNFHPDIKPLFCVRTAKTRWGHFKNIISTAFHYSKPIIKSFLGR